MTGRGRAGSAGQERGPGKRTNAPLSRKTVNLTQRAQEALSELTKLTGASETDLVCQALPWLAETLKAMHEGRGVYIENADGDKERIRFL